MQLAFSELMRAQGTSRGQPRPAGRQQDHRTSSGQSLQMLYFKRLLSTCLNHTVRRTLQEVVSVAVRELESFWVQHVALHSQGHGPHAPNLLGVHLGVGGWQALTIEVVWAWCMWLRIDGERLDGSGWKAQGALRQGWGTLQR